MFVLFEVWVVVVGRNRSNATAVKLDVTNETTNGTRSTQSQRKQQTKPFFFFFFRRMNDERADLEA